MPHKVDQVREVRSGERSSTDNSGRVNDRYAEMQSVRAEQRAHLDLKVTLLTEQKAAKLIDLLEELRRDLPKLTAGPFVAEEAGFRMGSRH